MIDLCSIFQYSDFYLASPSLVKAQDIHKINFVCREVNFRFSLGTEKFHVLLKFIVPLYCTPWPQFSLPPLLPSPPPTSLLLQTQFSSVFLQKRAGFSGISNKHGTTRYKGDRHKPPFMGQQGNSVGEKESKEQTRESVAPNFHCIDTKPQKHKI